MFNKDFYPTPESVIAQMTWDLDLNNKVVLEPSAGKGDIVDFCQNSGANVIACELNSDLKTILKSKCKVISDDFLNVTSEMISHIDYVIMNPPFSADEKHILHAWDIAPEGCAIIALCNFETVSNTRYSHRQKLQSIVSNYGTSENLGDVFSTAERKTEVEVGLIKLYKPKLNADSDFSEFFSMDADEEEEQYDGLIQHSYVREVVQRYVAAIKQYDKVVESSVVLNGLISNISKYGFKELTIDVNHEKAPITKTEFAKELQKSSWKYIFNKLDLGKFVTVKVRDDINKMIEKQSNIPFTMKNIHFAISALIQNVGKYMDESLLQVFDNLTAYYHDNRWNVEGWKTNSHYLVNQKFIHPRISSIGYNGRPEISFGRTSDEFDDLLKALCYITRTDFSKVRTLREKINHSYLLEFEDGNLLTEQQASSLMGYTYKMSNDYPKRFDHYSQARDFANKYPDQKLKIIQPIKFGEWFDWEFFEVKIFKKGTGHFKFKDRDIWATFNQHIARIKGYPLPEAIKPKNK
ncbi:DUF4942 domain-containing protein [Elizabethkingia sp. HX WHF]|uniref:DUF4942 domain-containing protein n=1 Tax=Elizabethkingia sp. HX WHF TaxID=3003190 RepID=UPI002A2421AE|nr:DUF4942 domain-containing protein [Elizabethkingia sp. HX WHF]MDX8564695.1 DUF4942 domain-containing protein [Elizabethkingia sp. HX WHF]